MEMNSSLKYNILMKKFFRILILILVFFCANFVLAEDGLVAQKKEAVALYNANKLEDAYQMIAKIPEENRDSEMWLLLANITEDYNNDIDAFFLLKKSLEKDPKYYKAYYNLGNLYMKDNRISKAIENFQLAAKYNKTFAYAYYNIGCCYYKSTDYKKAKAYFEKAVKLKTDSPDFYYNLALTYKKLHNDKLASKALDYYNNLQKTI